jgi:hypothetical protein
MNVPPRDDERGAGLIMVVMAAGLVAAIVTATTTMMNNQIKARVLYAKKAERMAAYEFVKQSLGDPNTLRLSAVYNSGLRNCIFSAGTCNAGATGPDGRILSRTAFRAYVPFSNKEFRVAVSSDSSTDYNGAYDFRGRHMPGCKFTKDCPYQIRTWYWAQCPNNTSTCSQAVRIFAAAQLVQRGPLAEKTKGFKFPTDKQMADNPYDETSFVMTSDITNSIYMTCPEGSSMVGTREIKLPDPKVPTISLAVCECAQGYTLDKSKGAGGYDKATNWPYCKLVYCDAKKNEVMSEIDVNGEVKCAVPQQSEYSCTSYPTPSTGWVQCGPNEKMRGLQAGDDCIIKADDYVDCPKMVITCCKKN